jgi:hypothetical protein
MRLPRQTNWQLTIGKLYCRSHKQALTSSIGYCQLLIAYCLLSIAYCLLPWHPALSCPAAVKIIAIMPQNPVWWLVSLITNGVWHNEIMKNMVMQ